MDRKTRILIQALNHFGKYRDQAIILRVDDDALSGRRSPAVLAQDLGLLRQLGVGICLLHGPTEPSPKTNDNTYKEKLIQSTQRLFRALEKTGSRPVFFHECGKKPPAGSMKRHMELLKHTLKRFLILMPSWTSPQCDLDTQAMQLSKNLHAAKLVYAGQEHGVPAQNSRHTIPQLTPAQCRTTSKKLSTRLARRLDLCASAVRAGVPSANILGAASPHSLLYEMFTDKGRGTLITGSFQNENTTAIR